VLNLPNVAALKLVSVVLLLQQLKVSFDLFLFLITDLLLHAGEGMLLSLLGDATLEALAFNPLLEELDLVLIVGLDGIHHQPVLKLLLFLVLLELTLLLEQFVLLKLTGKLVDFLAEEDLLSVSLVVERLLVREQLFLELLLTDGLDARLALLALLDIGILVLLLLLFGFEFELILAVESLEFLLLLKDATICLLRIDAMPTMGVGDRNLAEGRQTILGTSHIVHQNVIDILVGLSTLVDYLHLHALLKDKLKLRLLVWGECMRVLNQLNELLIS
jgi:hypothetical protein